MKIDDSKEGENVCVRETRNKRIKMNSSGINEQVSAIEANAFLWAS